jgi:hypothetical protein
MNNDSIYTPPSSKLKAPQELPVSYINSTLTSAKLRILAWITILYSILSIPMTGFEILSPIVEAFKPYESIKQVVSLLNIFLWCYLIIMFKKFLNLRFDFYRVDLLINILIIISIVAGLLPFLPLDQEFIRGFRYKDLFSFVLIVPIGVVFFLFGKRLLKIADRFRYLKTFSWLSMITGILLATIVLILFGVILGIVIDIVMAFIFFEAARERREWQAAQ